jgi:hypothetical protein
MEIKVLGPGCPKCEQTEKVVKEAVREAGVLERRRLSWMVMSKVSEKYQKNRMLSVGLTVRQMSGRSFTSEPF